MTHRIGTKRKLLICLLAFAMGASAMTGGMLLDVNAESMNAADLVTVADSVKTANKAYTLNGGGETGGAGLYIAPATPNTPYDIDVNGIFTGSFGMKFRLPGEGFWDQPGAAEVVISVSSLTSPDSSFEIHFGNSYQTVAYVTYEWEGQTLYRSRYSRWNDDYDGGDYLYTETLCKNPNEAQYTPIFGNFGIANDATRSGYVGIEADTDGVYNVVLYGIASEPNRKKVASFNADASTFEPVSAERGTQANLPKLDMEDGYTVSVSVKDTWTGDDIDFVIDSFAESESGDPYSGNERVYSLNSETLTEKPAFYTTWENTPFLSVGDYAYLNSSYVGAEVTLPEVSVVQAGQAVPFTGTITVTDSEGTQTAAGGKYTVRNRGAHTVRYEQSGSTIEIAFSAYGGSYAVGDVIKNVQGTLITSGVQGISVDGTEESAAYSGTFAGIFSGNAEFEFTFPEAVNGGGAGDEFTYIIRDTDGAEVFRIVYRSQGWNTSAYVVYGDQIRAYSKGGDIGGDWTAQAYYYRAPTGQEFFSTPCLNNYKGAHQAGAMPGEGWDHVKIIEEGGLVRDAAPLKDILDKYSNAFFVSGHNHRELDAYRVVFPASTAQHNTFIQTGGTAYIDKETTPGVNLRHEGWYVRVYSDRVVLLGREFTTGKWLSGACYVFDLK